MSVNKVILIGRLGRDPELRYTPSGAAVAQINLATTEKWTGKDGKVQEQTEWHKVIVWGKTAELSAKYLSKGSQAYVEGRLTNREYVDKKTGQTRVSVEIKAESVQFLDPSKANVVIPKVAAPSILERVPAAISVPMPEQSDFQESDIPF